jgi:hypothetical protein
MGSKSSRRSTLLGLVLACALLGTVVNSANAGPNSTSVIKPNTGSTFTLRLKGAVDALFDPLSLRKAPKRRPPGAEYIDLGPLE